MWSKSKSSEMSERASECMRTGKPSANWRPVSGGTGQRRPCLPACLPASRRALASLTEQGHVSVWPVDLQQVDVVCAQALQALVERLLDV